MQLPVVIRLSVGVHVMSNFRLAIFMIIFAVSSPGWSSRVESRFIVGVRSGFVAKILNKALALQIIALNQFVSLIGKSDINLLRKFNDSRPPEIREHRFLLTFRPNVRSLYVNGLHPLSNIPNKK